MSTEPGVLQTSEFTDTTTAKKKAEKWFVDPKDPEMYLRLETGIWYVRRKMKGKKPLFKSTGESGKGKARHRADQIIRQWMGLSLQQMTGQEMLFGDYAPIALQSILESDKYRQGTKINAQDYIPKLIDEIGYARLSEINEGFVEAWVQKFKQKQVRLKGKKARKTYRDFVSYISKVLHHARRNGLIAAVPKFENPDPKKETGRCFTKVEMSRMIRVAEEKLAQAREGKNQQMLLRRLNMLAQLRGCFNAFLRKRECLCAPWSEINLETGLWEIPKERVKTGSKTGKGKSIYVPQVLLDLLSEIRRLQLAHPTLKDSKWVFPNPYNIDEPTWDNKTAWETLKRDAQIDEREKPARFHDLRHTALSWALVGDDEFQARLEKATPEVQEQMRKELINPLLVSKYAGTNIRTIEAVYLKVKAEHTREVSSAIRL